MTSPLIRRITMFPSVRVKQKRWYMNGFDLPSIILGFAWGLALVYLLLRYTGGAT